MSRDHEPVVIENFGGLWMRGDPESAPLDHFIGADNVQYFHSGVESRDPLSRYLPDSIVLPNFRVRRIYNYVMMNGYSLLVLIEGGMIYHIIPPGTVHGPILTIPAMEDFGFVAVNGRAYITPFHSIFNTQNIAIQLGLQNDFVYVYKGDGTQARKAAGKEPIGGALLIESFEGGLTDEGFHLIAVVYETDTGFLTGLGPQVFGSHSYTGLNKIRVSNIPVSPDAFVRKRHLVSTKQILEYNGDQTGYQFFFIPGGNIDNNVDTVKVVEYFDADLVADASHLMDNFSEIPAGVNLNTYHSRLVIVGEHGTTETLAGLPAGITDNRSIARVSYPGEPEAISKVDGLIIAPLDGNPLTNCQEFRDVLYLFKKTRTLAYSDNNDVPASWQEEILDQDIGAPVHGIGTVLDTGGVNTDFLLIVDWSGLMLFNGVYARPELSWKIADHWSAMHRNAYHDLQIVNDSIGKRIWITQIDPFTSMLLYADYSNGMDAKNIRWARWIFDVKIKSICLTDTDKLVIGSNGAA